MEEIAQLADKILLDWQDGRIRLWPTDLATAPKSSAAGPVGAVAC